MVQVYRYAQKIQCSSIGRLLQTQNMEFHWASGTAPANAGYAISLGRQSDGSCTCRICNFNGSVGRLLHMQDMQFHWVSRTAPAYAGFAISMGQSDGSCTCRICNFTPFQLYFIHFEHVVLRFLQTQLFVFLAQMIQVYRNAQKIQCSIIGRLLKCRI